ncbi:hypothetical protein P170DRAFT_433293 [Aspergillus steynii IBT 23096]|uniref:Uncharacterized protein n=1 Tax=Aspergillus steynii IBT 23096 TaxID=1392250 RepID=A0A2I2GSG5_9EURO|nr:uncharacterized protein P170DRAFT_433293 [Aspergillus steynii IBT 23096]PLB55813.1 hypothetical protein P170DRAFT_433293 [Aspergillus steynii IBT 23096]
MTPITPVPINETTLPEQLFLDFSIHKILHNDTNGFPITGPWSTEYVASIRTHRYGDAVWARYHIAGDVDSSTGLIEGTNQTVLEMIEEDALGYRAGDPDLYAEALESVYGGRVSWMGIRRWWSCCCGLEGWMVGRCGRG